MFNKQPDADLSARGSEETRLQISGFDQAPAVVAYALSVRVAGRPAAGSSRYTEDLEIAKQWVDAGGYAGLVKAWRLPNGRLALRDPITAAVPTAPNITALGDTFCTTRAPSFSELL